MRPLRIAHLTTVASSLRYLLEAQLIAARDQGHDVVAISAPGDDVARLEALGIRHVALRSSTRAFSPRRDVRAGRELWAVLREVRPDILHTHNPKPGIYGRVLGRAAKIPIIVNTVHGLYATEEDPWAKRAFVYALEGAASRCSHAELVQNPEDYELMKKRRIAPAKKLRLLGNGVDLDRFRPDEQGSSREAIRNQWGVDPEDIVVGIVARLVAEKGYLELFEAVSRASRKLRLVSIGPSDPQRPDGISRDAIDRARRSGAIFLGQVEDPAPCYHGMDIFALPSHREGFPRAAMEAAASGVPVVAADVRGCRQVVEHERTGLLVPRAAPDDLRNALLRLADDPEKRVTMGAAARDKSLRDFDEQQIVGRVMWCYEELAGTRSRSDEA